MMNHQKGYFHSTTSIHNFLTGFLRYRQKRARCGRSGGGLPPRRIGRLGAAGMRAPACAGLDTPAPTVLIAVVVALRGPLQAHPAYAGCTDHRRLLTDSGSSYCNPATYAMGLSTALRNKLEGNRVWDRYTGKQSGIKFGCGENSIRALLIY